MKFGIPQRPCLFIILCFDRRFFLGADRLDSLLDLFHRYFVPATMSARSSVPAPHQPRLLEPTLRRWRSFQPLLHRSAPGCFWCVGRGSELRVRSRSCDRSQDPARPSSPTRSDRGRTRATRASLHLFYCPPAGTQPRFRAARSSDPILLESRFAFVRDPLPDSLIPVLRFPHLPAKVPAKCVRSLRKNDVTLGPLYLLMPRPF